MKYFYLLSLLPTVLLALPENPTAVAGSVQIEKQEHALFLHTQERTILEYPSFHIDEQEMVHFIQPSSSSCVLNRICSDDPSVLLGRIESNGMVFLLNPHGFIIGKDCVIHASSFLASTLDIQNKDFLEDHLHFFTTQAPLATISNAGTLASCTEGSIILLAPIIENSGTIQAEAGQVLLLGGSTVTLAFDGHKLLSFAVEESLENAILPHLQQASHTPLFLPLPCAKKAMKEVVNHSGIERGEVFVEVEGEMHLVATQTYLSGKIDTTSSLGKDGKITAIGSHMTVQDLQATGALALCASQELLMDSNSEYYIEGPSSEALFFAHDHLLFDGKFFTKDSLIESSTPGILQIGAPHIQGGTWLIDPVTIEIQEIGGGIPHGCVTGGVISGSIITSQSSTVILCADTIVQHVPLAMQEEGIGLYFQAPIGKEGELILYESIATKGGSIIVNRMHTTLGSSLALSIGAGGDPSAELSLGSIDGTEAYQQSILLSVEIGHPIQVGAMGQTTALEDVFFDAKQDLLLPAIEASTLTAHVRQNALVMTNPITLTGEGGLSVEARAVVLGSTLTAKTASIVALTSILSQSPEQYLTISPGPTFLNASKGFIGNANHPIGINTNHSIAVGANPSAHLQGTPFHDYTTLPPIPGNRPCFIYFNEKLVFDCQLVPSYLQGPLFPSCFFSPNVLGIGYSPIENGNTGLFSPFENLAAPPSALYGPLEL